MLRKKHDHALASITLAAPVIECLCFLPFCIKLLESKSDTWSGWLRFGTALVIAGVALELIAFVIELIHDNEKPEKYEPAPEPSIQPSKVGLWRRMSTASKWELMGSILVIGGVVLELYADTTRNDFETALRRNNSDTQELLQRESDEAKANVAGLELEVANANKATEDERLARTKLESTLAPRRLTREQQKRLASVADGFPGFSVTVGSYSLDLEAAVLCGQIYAVFAAPTTSLVVVAGEREVKDECSTVSTLGAFAFAIHVSGNEPQFDKEIIEVLRSFHLQAADTPPPPPTLSQGGTEVPAAAKIFVGVKPISQ